MARMNPDAPISAYPNLGQVAQIIHVPKSTLSHRRLDYEPFGNQKRFRPAVVLAEALYFRRRRLEEVVNALVAHAREVGGDGAAEEVRAETDAALEHIGDEPLDPRLAEVRANFERAFRRMQEGDFADRMQHAFETLTPDEMGRAAAAAARRVVTTRRA